jgi:hypothetical protein
MAPLLFLVACGGEVLVIGENSPDDFSSDSGEEDAFDDGYNPYGDGIASGDSSPGPYPEADIFEASSYDANDFEAWPAFSDDHCTTSGEACSCAYDASGHVYSLDCSIATGICDCDYDGTQLTSTPPVAGCGEVDGGPPTLAELWLEVCQFPL